MDEPSKAADPLLAVDRYIARLYRSGLEMPLADYRSWALTRLAEVIPHDGALWGSGTITDWRFHSRTVVGLPADFPAQLEATSSINPLLPKIIANLETPVDMESVMADDAFLRSDIYRRVFGPQGIHCILSTGISIATAGCTAWSRCTAAI